MKDTIRDMKTAIIRADIIRGEVARKNLTYKDIARALGIAPATLRNYVYGKRRIPADTLFTLAEILEVPPNTFVRYEKAS